MGLGRIFLAIFGCIWVSLGHCQGGLWLIEQDFVKYGKKEAYEGYKKEQQKDFVKKVGFPRYAIEDGDAGIYYYLTPVQDFGGLSSLMDKRISFRKMLTQGDEQQILPFLSTVKFFIESVHRGLPECSFVPPKVEPLRTYSAVYYYLFGIVPGNGPAFEEHLRKIVANQQSSENPVCFRTWRVVFGGDEPSYIVAVFANSPKDAKSLAEGLSITDGQIKNILRQEKKGGGMVRKDLSSMKG